MKTLPIKPRIAIVIAAWNAEKTLRRAIESAQAQTIPIEIIVIDDASTDSTLLLAQDLAGTDPRIQVLAQAVNQGPAAARNRGFATTTAEWVTILDSDDFMDPKRLERLLAIADEHNADIVADDLYKVPENDPYGPATRMFMDRKIGLDWLTTARFVRYNLSSEHGGRRELGFLKPIISRKFLTEHELTYSDIKLGEDYVLYANALVRHARFLLTDPAGYYAVVRPDSLSGSHPTECHADLMDADKAMLARSDVPADARQALEIHMMEQHKKWAWRRLIDAKRDRSPTAAIACFNAPMPVAFDLAKRLSRDIAQRAIGLRTRPGRKAKARS